MTVLVDTNVFIRLLVFPRMGHLGRPFREARAFIGASERGELEFTTSEAVVTEAVFVMASVYKADRDEIARGLTRLLMSPGCVMPTRDVCAEALRVWSTTGALSIVDALLAVTAMRSGFELATLDDKLARYSTAPIWTSSQED